LLPSTQVPANHSSIKDLGSRNILEEGCNQVKKTLLVVSRHDAEVLMDLLKDKLVDKRASGIGAVHRSLAIRNQEVHLLSSQVVHMPGC